MKRISLATFLVLVAALLALPTFAQSGPTKATIPFAFYAGNKLMPAGTYVAKIAANDRQILLTCTDNGRGAFLMGLPTGSARALTPAFRFDKIGDSLFLTSVTSPDESILFAHPSSEKELLREKHVAQVSVPLSGN